MYNCSRLYLARNNAIHNARDTEIPGATVMSRKIAFDFI